MLFLYVISLSSLLYTKEVEDMSRTRRYVVTEKQVTRVLNGPQIAWLIQHKADFPDVTLDGKTAVCKNQQVADQLEQVLIANRIGM